MSREIRFRVYSKRLKVYIDYYTIGFSKSGELQYLSDKHGAGPVFAGDYIVEQYTGLKDKNGKDIYEGDIVEEDIEVGDDDIDGEYRYQVVWDEETLCWSLSPNYGTIHKDLWETNLSREVIGNIHENPKLLGGEE